MKKIRLLMLFLGGCIAANAQSTVFDGLTQSIPYDKMIVPLGIEVTYLKTTHILFPAPIRSADLGSDYILGGKSAWAENVLRVKAAIKGFTEETNFSVTLEDGSFYSFNVRYSDEPEQLSVSLQDLMNRTEQEEKKTDNTEVRDVRLKELKGESTSLVDLILKSIYRSNRRKIKHIGCSRFGIQSLVKGIYTHEGFLYVHVQVKNTSNIPFTVDFARFKILDKKLPKRTAVQEKVIVPVRSYNEEIEIEGNSVIRTVFCLPKFTIEDTKILILEIYEKDGGRDQSIRIESTDIGWAKTIGELKTEVL
jgi:conjugative transposon TraN protein